MAGHLHGRDEVLSFERLGEPALRVRHGSVTAFEKAFLAGDKVSSAGGAKEESVEELLGSEKHRVSY